MLALWVRPGLVINLEGDLGAGKSTLARALIRAVADDPELEVPSPTFAMLQSYDTLRVPILHADLYRLNHASEAASLGLFEMVPDHVVLVEWPDRLADQELGKDILRLNISGQGEARDVAVEAQGKWQQIFLRNAEIEGFLSDSGHAGAKRQFLQGDASTRRYETITTTQGKNALMDMPARADHTVVKHNKSYSALVHLADDITPVIAINQHLVNMGYSAPKIIAANRGKGLALIEYLDGDVHGDMMRRGDDMTEPMRNAVAVLANMASVSWPRSIKIDQDTHHQLPEFDVDAQLYEVDLMPSWFWPQLFGQDAPQSVRQSFEDVWRALLPLALPQSDMWMLRDYHSPNLIWLPERKGLQRTGIIDTQDAVMGHPAYDLVSLLQDARVDVAPDFQHMLYADYGRLRGQFDQKEFARAYAVLGAQRATRLLGTFTRLSKRDGKHHYLQHRPRVARYLVQNLAHPAMMPLARWYEQHLPQVLELARS